MVPVVSFYTVGTPYEDEVKMMESSAREVGIREIITYPVSNKGSWEANCQEKAQVLLRAVADLGRKPFLYVDSDARFKQFPVLIDYVNIDFAAHYFRGRELLSGTLWVNPTVRTVLLLGDWALENRKNPKKWDQRTLQSVLERRAGLINFCRLPPQFTWIHDLSPRVYGNIEPVICHYQASRRYKRRV